VIACLVSRSSMTGLLMPSTEPNALPPSRSGRSEDQGVEGRGGVGVGDHGACLPNERLGRESLQGTESRLRVAESRFGPTLRHAHLPRLKPETAGLVDFSPCPLEPCGHDRLGPLGVPAPHSTGSKDIGTPSSVRGPAFAAARVHPAHSC